MIKENSENKTGSAEPTYCLVITSPYQCPSRSCCANLGRRSEALSIQTTLIYTDYVEGASIQSLCNVYQNLRLQTKELALKGADDVM